MLSFFKHTLQKIYTEFTQKAGTLFSRKHLDEEVLKELEILLLSADTGVKTTRNIIDNLKQRFYKGDIQAGDDLKRALEQQLLAMLETKKVALDCSVYLLVGINGSGKTTFAAKLAYALIKEGKKVLLIAADTFRAAGTEQLARWAERIEVDIITGTQGQDPASVVFTGCQKYIDEAYDALIIDTAGRLQTKINLMKQLEKIKRIIQQKLPHETMSTLLTLDAMLGQNSFEQAQLFNESTQLDGIVLTKMDGTGKGGIIFVITQELDIPIAYITYGEQLNQFAHFDAKNYVTELLTVN